MTLVKCPGCPKKFGRGLSTHQRHCPGLQLMAKTRFKMREENLKKKLAVKLAHQSQKAARDDFRERRNFFLSVSWLIIFVFYFLLILQRYAMTLESLRIPFNQILIYPQVVNGNYLWVIKIFYFYRNLTILTLSAFRIQWKYCPGSKTDYPENTNPSTVPGWTPPCPPLYSWRRWHLRLRIWRTFAISKRRR